MSDTDGKGKTVKLSPEVQAMVDTALAAQTVAETALQKAQDEFDADVKEGEANGRKTILDRIKTRFAANEDPAFTIATIADEDAEYQAAYTEHLKTALSKSRAALKKRPKVGEDDPDAAEFDEDETDGAGTVAKFETLVADKMAADAKLSKGKASQLVIAENPKAHAEFVKRTNAARKSG